MNVDKFTAGVVDNWVLSTEKISSNMAFLINYHKILIFKILHKKKNVE